MKKQSVDLVNESKTMSNCQFPLEGRARIVLKYGTIVDVPSEYANIVEELSSKDMGESWS